MPRTLTIALAASFAFSFTACSSEEPVDDPDVGEVDDVTDVTDEPDASEPPDPPDYDIATGPLEVGYARVEIPWRVGTKPGQVGTPGKEGFEMQLANSLAPLVPILHAHNFNPDPERVLRETTDWAFEHLQEQTEDTSPGEYSTFFEPGDGIEQPSDIKALVVQRGDLKVAIVRADIYLMHDYIHMRVADLVKESTGLEREQIFLAGTHNHSAPQPSSPAIGVWSLADGFDPRHFVYLTHHIAEAIEVADQDLRPARLRTTRTEYRDVQFNIIGPRTIEFGPDGEDDPNAETIHVGYPRDHFDADLDLLYFDEADDPHEPIALVFSLGMHPETLPTNHGLLSGDFALHAEKHLHRRLDLPAMWLPGALGDIEPDGGENNPDHDFWRHSFDALHQLGNTLADGVEEAFEALLDSSKEPKTEPKFRNISRDIPGTEDYPLPTSAYLEGMRFATPRILHGSSLVRIHLVRLGDALLIGLPAEITSDLSFNIKSRVNDEAGDVYQGYLYPENPAWVEERVQQNFSTHQVDPNIGAPYPIVTSMVNGYIGYVVTRWEYENREHYRMHMTPHGPESADHLASHVVAFTEEMMGGDRIEFDFPPWLDDDLAGVAELMAFYEGLDDLVPQLQRQIPAADEALVGSVVAEPSLLPAEAIDDRLATHDAVAFSWHGGSNDMPPPRVHLERLVDDDWQPVHHGPGAFHIFYDGDQQWTARWHPEYEPQDLEFSPDEELRFQVQGTYRGDTDGTSEPHPLWDPDGRDAPYEVTSEPFTIAELI